MARRPLDGGRRGMLLRVVALSHPSIATVGTLIIIRSTLLDMSAA